MHLLLISLPFTDGVIFTGAAAFKGAVAAVIVDTGIIHVALSRLELDSFTLQARCEQL
jgi:hypothetical protein